MLNFPTARASALRDISQCHCRQCCLDANAGQPYWRDMMETCPKCGNKRCPHVDNHRFHCTRSNAPDQKPRMSIRAAVGNCEIPIPAPLAQKG